jgi:hypothetical protein
VSFGFSPVFTPRALAALACFVGSGANKIALEPCKVA